MSPDQKELEVREAVLLYAMRQDDMESFRRLAVELKIRGLPDDVRSQAQAPGGGDAGAPVSEEVAAQVEVEVHHVMAELAPENLGSLAEELGIPEDELKTLIGELPDNFEEMVADEVKATLPSDS